MDSLNLVIWSLVLVALGAVGMLWLVREKVQRILFQKEIAEAMPYVLKQEFFNASEWAFLNELERQIDLDRYSVFPKVRLEDYIVTTATGIDRKYKRNRIKSGHVDFVIWDKHASKLVLAIEVDGSSQRSERALQRDDFKNRLFETVGLKLVRIKTGTNFSAEIDQLLRTLPN